MSKKKWIQDALKGSKGKWSLHAMLNIKEGTTIPITLLKAIIRADIGKTVHNPTKTGKAYIKVTKKLKQKALFAHNVRK
jgi:hypothetical protein